MVYHQLDTFGGNSGSPIFYVKDGECRIVAIHTGGDKNTSNWGIRNT
jgi:V8-like Glu-specific endopeptidase